MSRSEQNADRIAARASWRWGAAVAFILVASGVDFAYAQTAPAPARPAEQTGPGVVLEADTLVNDEKAGQIIAEGNVEARYQGRTLRAEKLVYDVARKTVRAQGRVEIVDADGSVRFAEDIEVDDELNAGVATGFGMRIPGGGTAAAASAVRRPDGVVEMNRITYTACPLCAEDNETPSWSLRARKATQNPNTDMISYQSVTLLAKGVPVFYLPYFTHPDPTAGRRSGFLTPDLGSSRRVGAYYEQPYYWAISPSQDMTVSPRFHSKVNPLLSLRYRKRFWSGELALETSGTYEQDFRSSGEKFGEETYRSHIYGGGRFEISDYWDWNFAIARTSDDLYLRRYGIPGTTYAQGLVSSDLTRLISQVQLNGQDDRSFASIALASVQGLRVGDESATLPLMLPVGEYERVLRDPLLDGQIRLQASTATLVREKGVNSARISTGVRWQAEKVIGPGVVVSPFAEARNDVYRVSDFNNQPEETFSRALGVAGGEISLPLANTGANANIIVEPIVALAYASDDSAQEKIPNEDAVAFELDESSLFRSLVVPNYDLWESGGRVAVGVRASAISSIGSANVVIGRRWKEEEDSTLFPASSNLHEKDSDYVGALSADLAGRLGGTVRFRFDDETLDLSRVDASVRGALWRVAANARYFRIDETLRGNNPSEEIAATVQVRLIKNWRASYGMRRDLNSDRDLSQYSRLTYQDDCTFLEFVYSRSGTSDRSLGPREGFQVRIGLSTLGMVGSSN